MLAEQEVVLYCDFHGHSRKNNVFMYGCDAGGDGTGTRLRQRVFPLMLSKNAPDKVGHGCLRATCCGDSGNAATVLLPQLSLWGWDPSDPGTPQFSFSSCKFQVQKSKERTGRVCMWRLGVSHSYTLEVAFSGSTLGEGLPQPRRWYQGGGPGLGSCPCFLFPVPSRRKEIPL